MVSSSAWTFPYSSEMPVFPPHLPPGAASAVPAAGSHRHGDEGGDHPEAAGPQSRPDGEHQQLPQPVREAAHQRQVRRRGLAARGTGSRLRTAGHVLGFSSVF